MHHLGLGQAQSVLGEQVSLGGPGGGQSLQPLGVGTVSSRELSPSGPRLPQDSSEDLAFDGI